MKHFFLFFIVLFSLNNLSNAKENLVFVDSLFHIDQMNSHDENFALYFKTREKAVLARGENSNYINDFPKRAQYYLKEYDFPVFPDDFAYYLLNDNKTLIMISAVKSLKANFKFDIYERKLELYPVNGKFEFIISSIAKNCGYSDFKENYKCFFYKPLISSALVN